MQVVKEIKYKLSFEMKDKKTTYGPFNVSAENESSARATLTDHMGQILDQLELADKKEKEATDKVAERDGTPA